MTRYDAYIEKNWEGMGLAHLMVARIREGGDTDFAVFLVDLFCLGLKDVIFEPNIMESSLREFVDEQVPEDFRERIHPTCAKKLIEGAVAYAQALGFAPPRNFRKARKVLSGLDAALCPREFTFGRDGKPCFIRGSDDSEERVDRVCAILEAKCGADGFDYEDPGEEAEENALAVRGDLLTWLEAEPENVPRFYELGGLMTAMLICPTVIAPLKVFDVLWGEGGREWKDAAELNDFSQLLMAYWNQLSYLVQDAVQPDASPGTQIVDVWEQDFEDLPESGLAMTIATVAWTIGFRRATELWPEAWGDALTRPDLVPHWEVVGWWADFELKENRDNVIAHAEAKKPRTLNAALVALARALRPLAGHSPTLD